jgi:hypothetical protein
MPRGRNKNKTLVRHDHCSFPELTFQYPAKGARAEKAAKNAENKGGNKPEDWVSHLPDNKNNELFEEYYRVCSCEHCKAGG